jgi:hypothetical protein
MDIFGIPIASLGISGVLLLACGALFGIIIRVQARNAAESVAAAQKKYDDMVALKDTEYRNMVDVKNGLIQTAIDRGNEWLAAANKAQDGRDKDREVLGEQIQEIGAQLSRFTGPIVPELKIPPLDPRTGHNVGGEVDHVGA